MRHGVFGRKLSKDTNERKSLFKNLISSLFLHGEIQTTETRAKAIKGLVDKLVSRARQETVNTKKQISAFLQDKKVVDKLFKEIAPRYKTRPGGFTRIIRLGNRQGDQAGMVKMEMVEGEKGEETEEKEATGKKKEK